MRRRRSDWSGGGFPERRPPRAAPEHGIKVAKIGTTWWGQQWIEALERTSSAYSARLGRGRTYARAGRVHDLVVSGSRVTAKVTGSSSRPYTIEIALAPLSDATWQTVLAALAAEARFAASLLSGEMPKDIDEVFQCVGASLFPTTIASGRAPDMTTSCSCPDWANPCKHVAATHYVLGDALERDPFLLFELRGKSKTDVLEALRAQRGGDAAAPRSPRARKPRRVAGVSLGETSTADYDRPAAPWPALGLTFERPKRPGDAIAQLGLPPSWRAEHAPVDLLGTFVEAASERAWRAAMARDTSEDEREE